MPAMEDRHERTGVRPLSLGLNDNEHAHLLRDGESPELLNVELQRSSITPSGGATKMNNQTAPRPGLLVGVKAKNGRLGVLPGKSVPARGHLYFPYNESQDLGGGSAGETYAPASEPYKDFWPTRRGSEFERQISFQIPIEEKLFPKDTQGQLTSIGSGTTWETKFGSGLELDEFMALRQKGGDRFTPMSWAIGIINTGRLFDTDVGGGLNIFGVATSLYANRVSNYALCFLWLDSPQANVIRPVHMRYNLSDGGSVHATETGAEGYCTLAYRAFVVPFFVQPGRTYHTTWRLFLDSDTVNVGTSAQPGIDGTAVSWNDDGKIEVRVARDYEASQLFSYDQASPGSATLYRYKGPTDSLEYLTKYGVRYHGRDAEFAGLGYRYAAWSSAGFVPTGIDSCPVELGGFGIADHSILGPAASTLYSELTEPDREENASNLKTLLYDLRIAHDPAKDGTGTLFEVNEPGLVQKTTWAGHSWGNETGVWAQIDAHGKLPWAPYDQPWSGLGGLGNAGGFNPEALKSYRLVALTEASGAGFHAEQAVGALFSIDSYVNADAYATPVYTGQHLVMEGGDQFLNTPPDFGPTGSGYTKEGLWFVGIRAFRWNQRPVYVGGMRSYSTPRTWSAVAEFELTHELVLDDAASPGIENLVGYWPCTDGEGSYVEDLIAGNGGIFSPMSAARIPGGSKGKKALFLSGEGEGLTIDLLENPDFRKQLFDALADGQGGAAIQFTVRMPEAYYGMTQRVDDPFGAPSLYRARFAPPLAVWDYDVPDRKSALDDVAITSGIDPIDGWYERPAPLLQFGHDVEVESGTGVAPTLHPLGFNMMVPADIEFFRGSQGVPGSGSTPNLHAWQNNTTSLWSKTADWVGREITFQFGLQPIGEDQFYAYIAAWPKDALFAATNDGPSAEFAYWADTGYVFAQDTYRRLIERSRIVIGGSWFPRRDEIYGSLDWEAKGRPVMEANARMIVEDVHVFAAPPAGALPSSSGGITPTGTGKLVGLNAMPQRELFGEDLLNPIDQGSSALNLVAESFEAAASGKPLLPVVRPETSKDAVLRTFLQVLGDEVSEPEEATLGQKWNRTYFVKTATAAALTLNRPFVGPSRSAAPARSFRHAAYTAFSDAIEDRPLTLGKGKGYDLELVTTKDAHITAPYFANLAPPGMGWRFRVYSSLAGGRVLDILPRWVRGLVRSRANPVRGLHSQNETLFAGAQGSLFEVDDRWRPGQELEIRPMAFAFRSKRDAETDVLLPLQEDRIVFDNAAPVDLADTLLQEGASTHLTIFDAQVTLDDYGPAQSIAVCQRIDTDPSLVASVAGVQWWMRISNGYPELGIGTSGTAGGSAPPGGMLWARGATRVPLGEHRHIRWILFEDVKDGDLQTPVLLVEGKLSSVTLSGVDDAAGAGGWIPFANLVIADANFRVVMGAAWAAMSFPRTSRAFSSPSSTAGEYPALPSLMQGFMHSLCGKLSLFAVVRSDVGVAGFELANFDPHNIDYDTLPLEDLNLRLSCLDRPSAQWGVGHKMFADGVEQWGTIYSHPFISLWHESGSEDAPWSFADFESAVFAANGRRPLVAKLLEGERNWTARFSGLIEPATAPDVEIVRTPIWKPNYFDTAGDPDNDPIYKVSTGSTALDLTAPTVSEKVFGYRNPGSIYLAQASEGSMRWTIDKYFAFKCLFRLNRVSGRISLFSRRSSPSNGGPFIEVRDGYVVVGWYDTEQKREVYMRTSKPIIDPGYDYYLYYRKFFPRGGLTTPTSLYYRTGSNWADSHVVKPSSTRADYCYDSLVVRRIPRVTPAAEGSPGAFFDWTGYDLKSFELSPGGNTNYDYTAETESRACVPFTAADAVLSPNPYSLSAPYSGTGYVIYDATVDSAASAGNGGRQIAILASSEFRFCLDHVGMFLQVSGGSTFSRQTYRIVKFIDALTVECVNKKGTNPVFTVGGLTSAKFSVFTGVSLVKSEGYDDSVSPDEADYAVEVCGSSLSANPLNGFAPFDGKLHSFAYGIFGYDGATVDSGGNKVGKPDIFEEANAALTSAPERIASATAIGTDNFGLQGSTNPLDGSLPKDGVPVGELEVDSSMAHTAVDTAAYFPINFGVGATAASAVAPGSTQPNSARELALDGGATSSAKPVWSYNNAVTTGLRRARITFFDPDALDESYISPERQVNIAAEDDNNPSAAVELVFSRLPASPDRRALAMRLYLTLANGTDLFQRVEMRDPVDSIAVQIDDINDAPTGGNLDFTLLGAPPKCYLVGVSQGRMIYANLENFADGVMFSLAQFPEQVPPTQVFPVDTGESAITGLLDLLGTLLIFKRNHISFWLFDPQTGLPTVVRQIHRDGCVAHQSLQKLGDRVFWISPRGPQTMQVGGDPLYLGNRISTFWREKLDRRSLVFCTSVINEDRTQYVFTAQSVDDAGPSTRFAIEVVDEAGGDRIYRDLASGYRITKYQEPACTALGEVKSRLDGRSIVVGGTKHGFAVWMDRDDSRMVMTGPELMAVTTTLWGGHQIVAGALDADLLDDTLEGMMGVILRHLGALSPTYPYSELEREVLFVVAAALEIYVLDPTELVATASGFPDTEVIAVGSQRHVWSTKAFDGNSPDLDKLVNYVDVTREPKASGAMVVDVYRNLSNTPEGSFSLLLTEAFHSEEVGRILQRARSFRFRFRTEAPSANLDFELLDLVLRHARTDVR